MNNKNFAALITDPRVMQTSGLQSIIISSIQSLLSLQKQQQSEPEVNPITFYTEKEKQTMKQLQPDN